ncbi:MAG: hypothetical protein L6R43_04805 [Planctomycetes bacterium]|nr:hypothetical protein [Planctomycetota bacterium]
MRTPRRRRPGREGMRAECDFTGGVRGKYAARTAKGSIVVVLDPDVAAIFRTAEEVNEALRACASSRAKRRKHPRPRA